MPSGLHTTQKAVALVLDVIDQAMKEINLPKYEKRPGYHTFLPGNIERMCYYWRIGWE